MKHASPGAAEMMPGSINTLRGAFATAEPIAARATPPAPPYEGGEVPGRTRETHTATESCTAADEDADDDSVPRSADDETTKSERAARLSKMRETAAKFAVVRPGESNAQQFDLREDALFRYSDQPRGFIDATLWVWGPAGGGGRPVGVAKVEMARSGKVPFWQFCLASLADHPLNFDYAGEPKLAAVKPGIEFRALPGARKPPERPALWPLHTRDLASQFAATIHALHPDAKELVKQEMRLLPTPLHAYSEVKPVPLSGTIFGLTTNGTNPDILIVIELRKEEGGDRAWYYGIVKITFAEVHVRFDKVEVWSSPISEPLDTWTFFRETREE